MTDCRVVYIAASLADARTTLGLTDWQLQSTPIITPRNRDSARGYTGDTLTITAEALRHPKIGELIDSARICLIASRRPSHADATVR